MVRSGHPILSDKKPDFFAYPYASPPLQGTMTGVRRPSVQDRARMYADNYTLLKTLVLESDYICGGPRHIFREELDSGHFQELANSPTVGWQSACLMKEESLDTPLVKLFVDIMIKQKTSTSAAVDNADWRHSDQHTHREKHRTKEQAVTKQRLAGRMGDVDPERTE